MSTAKRVAIVGGGMSALAAAMDLRRAGHEVTVYQMGWRLGGKGASGRNAAHGHRIEEHGLHLLAGYYENAFELIREAYADAGADWRRAFRPRNTWTLPHRGDWGLSAWTFTAPSNGASPGEGREWPSPRQVLTQLRATSPDVAAPRVDAGLCHLSASKPADSVPGSAWGRSIPGPDVRRRRRMQTRGPSFALGFGRGPHFWPLEAVDPRDPRLGHIVRLARVHLRGVLADELLTRGTGGVDDEDWRDWLARHGADRELCDGPVVRGMYDVLFAWRDGDDRRPSLSAGRILYAMTRFMLASRGALFWEMEGGMGDVVFAPLYAALRRRGVRFVFFHQLDDVALGPSGRVDRLRFRRQAEVSGEYQPLVDLDGVPVWPSEPDWAQIGGRRDVDFEAPGQPVGAPIVELRDGVDFDDVLLAIPPGAMAKVTSSLAEASPRFAAMVGMPTVRTLAAQVWSSRPEPWADDVVCGLDAPWVAWADMSHVLPKERWAGRVQRLGYACGVTGDDNPDAGATFSDWAARHRAWIDEDVDALGPERLYVRANVHPGEAYVLSTPDTLWLRPEPWITEFGNLYVAGDWIRTGYEIGTLESATIGGRKAARAIAGGTRTFIGEGGGREAVRSRVLRAVGAAVGRWVRGATTPTTCR